MESEAVVVESFYVKRKRVLNVIGDQLRAKGKAEAVVEDRLMQLRVVSLEGLKKIAEG